MEPAAECMLVLIGATPEGKKELVGFQVGARESAQSWRESLADLKGRGLTKDREALLAFFDFPAQHWDHLRTANPIESVFATVRHRTVRTKGALSQKTAKLMVFTLIRAASKSWRRLSGANQLPLVVEGIKFTDGVATSDATNRAA